MRKKPRHGIRNAGPVSDRGAPGGLPCPHPSAEPGAPLGTELLPNTKAPRPQAPDARQSAMDLTHLEAVSALVYLLADRDPAVRIAATRAMVSAMSDARGWTLGAPP